MAFPHGESAGATGGMTVFKDLSALKALVWVLSTMDDQVPKETSPMSKDLPTFSTHKRFLSSMSPAMQDKIGAVAEGFPHWLHC